MTALSEYANECRTTYNLPGTTEQSYYPAVKKLLEACAGEGVEAAIEVIAAKAKPDLALYAYRLPVLYVEVKDTTVSAAQLLGLEQAKKYARRLGNRVLITNLNDFVLADLVNNQLQVRQQVTLFAGPVHSANPRPLPQAEADLRALLRVGCQAAPAAYSPATVARALADHAKPLNDDALNEHFRHIHDAFKVWLGAELEDRFLTSTTVQLIVYGIFASWLQSNSPASFDWPRVRDDLGATAIAEIVYSALSPTVVHTSGVRSTLDGIAEALKRVDQSSLATDFDNNAIEYFYEPFLAAYDTDLRDSLGVWYTPKQIAAYQVARCDHHLRHHLGIEAGLANDKVIILDPATGTGTYLAAVYEHLFKAYQQQGHPRDLAAQMVSEAAKVRIAGFEILPAALVIGDLNLRRVLGGFGAPLDPTERPALYLANSLLGWFPEKFPPQMGLPWALAEREHEAASRYKSKDRPVLVVLGNPPYQGYSTADNPEEKELIEPWVAPLASQWGVRKHRMNDLYIRFWAAAARRIADLTHTGVVSFITNRKWLAGRSYSAMRDGLMGSFDEIIVDDLGGDSRGGSGGTRDESIFATDTSPGITVGTAIVTAVRFGQSHQPDPDHTVVHERVLTGDANTKRAYLDTFRDGAIDNGLRPLATSGRTRWKLTRGQASASWPGLDDYFNEYKSGVQTVRDDAVTDYDKTTLENRMADYFDPNLSWAQLAAKHPAFAKAKVGYNPQAVRNKLLARNSRAQRTSYEQHRVVKCLWGPLHGRWLYWELDHRLLNRPRPDLYAYWAIPEQVCLVSPGNWRKQSAARPLASTAVPIFEAMDPNCRVLPLWSPPGDQTTAQSDQQMPLPGTAGQTVITPNIDSIWIQKARTAGDSGTDSQIAESIFYAICGVAASPGWLHTQPHEHDDFPTIPVPADPAERAAAAHTGRRYAELVDPWANVSGVTTGTIRNNLAGMATPDTPQGPGQPVLGYGSYGRLGGKIVNYDLLWGANNVQQEEGWRNIPHDVLAFELGGWRTVRKNLSYLVGKPINYQDRMRTSQTVKRVAAIRHLACRADTHYRAAKAAPL